jgi:hypothetical protein
MPGNFGMDRALGTIRRQTKASNDRTDALVQGHRPVRRTRDDQKKKMIDLRASSPVKRLHSGSPPAMKFFAAAISAAFALISSLASAADYPAPREGDWITKDFRFHTGDVIVRSLPLIDEVVSTTGAASFYAQPLRELLQTAPQRTM